MSGIIAAAIVPAALEMLDNLMIRAVEQAFGFGFPIEAGAVLIIEVDGLDAGLDREAQAISEIVQAHGGSVGKSITWRTRKEPEYVAIWKSRKSAFGAIGRLSPTYCTQDGVVPRTKLPHILRHIVKVGERHNLRIANVFHAGDGNIHPILLFDERDADQVKRVFLASHEILDECIAVGGSVTGEHGIGVEKMEFMPKLFSPEDLAAMVAIRNTFNPEGRCNPSKMLPGGAGCIERKTPGARRRPDLVSCRDQTSGNVGSPSNANWRYSRVTVSGNHHRIGIVADVAKWTSLLTQGRTTTVPKRPRFSRWRRLPGVFRTGEHRPTDSGTDLDRIILYVPARILDLAEALAEKAGVPTVQDYCALLLMQSLENERVQQKVADFEARRGPLEGLKQIADDPDYLAEWQERSDAKPDGPPQSGPNQDASGPDLLSHATNR